MINWELVLRYYWGLGDIVGIRCSGRRSVVGFEKMVWASGSSSCGLGFWLVGVRDGRL